MSANKPEPMPRDADGAPVWETVIREFQERHEFGLAKYGKPLRPFDGRGFHDAIQEMYDQIVYTRKAAMEITAFVDKVKELKAAYVEAVADEEYTDFDAKLGELFDLVIPDEVV